MKKDSQRSVLVMGLAFLAPFLGFLRSTLTHRFLPGSQSISVPSAYSRMGSSSSTMWYDLESTALVKNGLGCSKWKSMVKPRASSSSSSSGSSGATGSRGLQVTSTRYLSASSSFSVICSVIASWLRSAHSQKSGMPFGASSDSSATSPSPGMAFSTSTSPLTMEARLA